MSNNDYDKFVAYVKRNRFNSSFSANNLRDKLNVSGRELATMFRKAVNDGLIERIGETASDVSYHKGGRIALYARSYNSY